MRWIGAKINLQFAMQMTGKRSTAMSNSEQTRLNSEGQRSLLGTWYAPQNCGATCTSRLSLARTPDQGSSGDFSIHELLLDINWLNRNLENYTGYRTGQSWSAIRSLGSYHNLAQAFVLSSSPALQLSFASFLAGVIEIWFLLTMWIHCQENRYWE